MRKPRVLKFAARPASASHGLELVSIDHPGVARADPPLASLPEPEAGPVSSACADRRANRAIAQGT